MLTVDELNDIRIAMISEFGNFFYQAFERGYTLEEAIALADVAFSKKNAEC